MVYCKNCGFELPADAQFCPRCGAPVRVESQTGGPYTAYDRQVPIHEGLKLATWGERFIAWLIDAIIVGVFVGLLGLFSWIAVGGWVWWTGWPSWLPFFNINFDGLILFLYWMIMEAAYGQSLGKMVMRIKVVRLNGNPVGIEQAALEAVGKAFLLPLDVLLGWIFFPRQKQRVFNYISATVVIRQR
jgi:uncharacterized RDD family membrane protein YckC